MKPIQYILKVYLSSTNGKWHFIFNLEFKFIAFVKEKKKMHYGIFQLIVC